MTSYFSLAGQIESDCSERIKSFEAIFLASAQPIPPTASILEYLSTTFQPAVYRMDFYADNAEGWLLDNDELPRVSQPGIGDPPKPLTIGSLKEIPPPVIDDLVFPMCRFQEDSPNIQCATNQCVPMAVANTIGYLENKYDGPFFTWPLAHNFNAGYGKTSDNSIWVPQTEESLPSFLSSLIAQVDARTRRTGTFDFSSGSGSSRCQMYNGLFGYLNSQGRNAVFTHMGGQEFYGAGTGNCDNPAANGNRVSTRSGADGTSPTWIWIFNELTAGNGVYLTYGRYNDLGERTGGHVLRVQGACRFGWTDYLYLLDDGQQGSNGDNFEAGLRVTQWKVEDTRGPDPNNGFAPDGRLNLGDTNWEIEFAQSVKAIPEAVFNPGFVFEQIPPIP